MTQNSNSKSTSPSDSPIWTAIEPADNYQLARAEDDIAVALEARRILGVWIANAISDHHSGWMDDKEYKDFAHGADVMMRALNFSLEQRRALRKMLGIARDGKLQPRRRKQD